MVLSMSFSDFLIRLCAGREAEQRLERKHTERYFKQLPDPPNDHSWAAKFDGSQVSVVLGQRSVKKPWEEPNSGIVFRHRYSSHRRPTKLPTTNMPYELLLPGESFTYQQTDPQIFGSTIEPTWFSQHKCSFSAAARPLPMLQKIEYISEFSDHIEEGNDKVSGCMFPSFRTEPLGTLIQLPVRIYEHKHQYKPARFRLASDQWLQLIETTGRHGGLDIASNRRILFKKEPDDHGLETYYRKRTKNIYPISKSNRLLTRCHGLNRSPSEDYKKGTILAQDMHCSNPGHASCSGEFFGGAYDSKESSPSSLVEGMNNGIQQLSSCLDPVSLIGDQKRTYILAHQWISKDAAATQNLLKLKACERERQDRKILRNRAWRSRGSLRLALPQSIHDRFSYTTRKLGARKQIKASTEQGHSHLPDYAVQQSARTYRNKSTGGHYNEVKSKIRVSPLLVDETSADRQKYFPSCPDHPKWRTTTLREAKRTTPKTNGDYRGTEYVNDHLLQTKAQRDLARYLPHLFPPRPSSKINVEPGSQFDFTALVRRNHRKSRIELSGLRLLTNGQSYSLVGGSDSSECAIIDTDSDSDEERGDGEGIVEEEGERQILSTTTMIVLNHIVVEEQKRKKAQQAAALFPLASIAEDFEAFR